MPIYNYRCPTCGRRKEVFKPLAELDRKEVCYGFDQAAKQVCHGEMERYLTPVMVRGDYAGYTCPVTGKWVEGRRQHQENLARTGCRILEPGEKEHNERRRRADDEALFEAIGETAAELTEALPTEKKERLAAELDNGFGLTVERH